jgi:hypothetical protein
MKSIAVLGIRFSAPNHELSGPNHHSSVSALQLLSILAMALILAISGQSPAQAQGSSVTIGKHQLQQATWPKAPLQIQILDERPRVKDMRTPEQAPENFVIPIPPMQTAKGQGAGASSAVRMEYNNLPSAGFGQSNIPAGGMAPARSLPTTKSGGLSPVDKPPRPIGLVGPQGGQRQLSVSAKTPTSAATYSKSYDRMSLLSGSSGSDQSVKKDVNGTLLHGQGNGR